jgi:anti-anti-sigma factor
MEPDTEIRSVTLALQGAIGIEEAAELQADVLNITSSIQDVVVDCSAAERLHCAAIQVLLSLQTALSERGGTVRIRDANASISQFAGMAGLNGLFDSQ